MTMRASRPLATLIGLAAIAVAHSAGAQESHARSGVHQGTKPGDVRHDPIAIIQATQPTTLPALPAGVSLDDIRAGDRIFHGKGGCADCHGANGEGEPDGGAALTAGLHYVATDVAAIDTLVRCGLAPATTRSSKGMPARGDEHNLTATDEQRVAAYVWAISQVQGEPWPGGHRTHAKHEEGDEGEKKSEKGEKGEKGGKDSDEGVTHRTAITARTTAPGCPVGSAAVRERSERR